jgi:methyl-accepting chemotaxis protein
MFKRSKSPARSAQPDAAALADGDLSFTPEVTDADEHTHQARENFVRIVDGMQGSVSDIAQSGRTTVEQTVEAIHNIDVTVADSGASIREMRDQSARSAPSSRPSTKSPSRPTCWR